MNVLRVLFGKLLLQFGIIRDGIWMAAKMIANSKMIAKRYTVLWADIQVVRRLIHGWRERLTTFDS